MWQSIPVELPAADQGLLVAGANSVEHTTRRVHGNAYRPVRHVAGGVDGNDLALFALGGQHRSRAEAGLFVHDLHLTAVLAARNKHLARTEDRNTDAWIPIFGMAVGDPTERAEAGGILELPVTLIRAADSADLMGKDGIGADLVAMKQG